MTRISLHEVGLAATEVPSHRTTVSNDVEETVWWNDDIVDIAVEVVAVGVDNDGALTACCVVELANLALRHI